MNRYIMLLLILSLSLVFAACGNDDGDKKAADVKLPEESKENNKNEDKINDDSDKENSLVLMPLDQFVEKYNNLASLTDELKPLTDKNERDSNNAQILLQEDTYGILAIFDENDDVIFYSVGLTRDDLYGEMKGNGLYATLNLAATLDMDFKKMTNEIEVSFNKDSHMYFDGGYVVNISNESGLGMLVQIMKFNDE